MWETALLCRPPGAAAGASDQVWETALLFEQGLIRQEESKFKAIGLRSKAKLLFLMNIKDQLAARLSLIRYAQRGFIIYLP